ncbi:MAG: PAS domain S-box protein, partial [Spirochaetaceae bacterium]|nr:PAS domain S-box protein [Spirochaetaceae bacterium]
MPPASRRPPTLLAVLVLLAAFARVLPAAAEDVAAGAAGATAADPTTAAPRAGGPGVILVLHSYQRDFSWTVGIEAGIEEVVASASPRASLLVEHLDAKRLEDSGRDEALADYLRSRYAGRPPDAIIASDNAALRFLVARRARLFPGVPVVFCGINDWSPALLGGQGGFTGVLERPDYAATIEAARSLFRGPRPVYLLSDHSSSGRATAKDCAGAILARFPDAELRDIPDLALDRLEAWSAGLPRDALIFVLSYVVDGAGRNYPPEEVVARLRAASGLPLVTSHDVYFAPGTLGGMVATAAGQGRAAAGMALAVLGGADPSSIPVRAEGVNEFRFSFPELKRLGLSESALPEGAVLVGRPATLFEREPRAAGALIAATVFLLAALLGLAAVVAVQRRIRLAAAASERRFRGLFESMVFGSSLHELVLDGEGRPVDYRFLDVNDEYGRLLGMDRSEVVGRTATEVYGSPVYLEEFAAVARGGPRAHLDLPFKGRILRTTVYSPDSNEFATVFEDVTERRAASLALEESERRYRNLFDSMEEGVIYEAADGETVSANDSALRILGLGLAELQGREAIDPRWRLLSAEGLPLPLGERVGA